MLRCQIHVFNPPEGTFTPMQRVSGIIRYTLYEEMLLKRIVVSLKGNGVLDIEGKVRRRFREDYVNINKTLQENPEGFTLGIGNYEENFDFELPTSIPGSIETTKETARHKADCRIQYYIRIKFDRGYLKADKSFKKIVVVKPLLVPSLPMVHAMFEKCKQLSSSSEYTGYVFIIAVIENSVLYGGDTITIHYELKNFTNTSLVRVLISLVEMHTFKRNRPFINAKSYNEIENTTSTTDDICFGSRRSDTVQIEVPNNISTLLHSTLVMREYFVKMVVQLPYPHTNIKLKIPVEIGVKRNTENDIGEDAIEIPNESGSLMYLFPPPSYWEAMGEMPVVDTEEDAT